MDIKTVLKRLRYWEYGYRLACLAIVLLYAFEVEPLYGVWAGDPSVEYVVQTLMVLLTLVSIPVCLKLIKWVTPSQIAPLADLESRLTAYYKWAVVRCSILWFAAMLTAMAYVTTLDMSAFWCLAVLCVSDWFISPSEERLRSELEITDNQK